MARIAEHEHFLASAACLAAIIARYYEALRD